MQWVSPTRALGAGRQASGTGARLALPVQLPRRGWGGVADGYGRGGDAKLNLPTRTAPDDASKHSRTDSGDANG